MLFLLLDSFVVKYYWDWALNEDGNQLNFRPAPLITYFILSTCNQFVYLHDLSDLNVT